MASSNDILLECDAEDYKALVAPLREAIESAAADYRRTHDSAPPLIVTSARRSLRHQAALMAAMSDAELEGMYARNGRPSYIDELEAARPLDTEKAYRILRDRKEGYISRHLYGLAADIAVEGVTDIVALRALLETRGCSVFDEREMARACLHVTITSPATSEPA